MNPARDRSWLLTILRMKMPVVVLLTFVVACIAALLTLLFSPIYSATTILAIDSELAKIVGTTGTGLPAIANIDYIRYEFFASHSVQLMQLPQIARKVIEKTKLTDRFGNPLHPEYFIHPDLPRLVFNNNGSGVLVDWITDTQTFAVAGMSKDPDTAVRLSREYAEAFLEDNANQYVGVVSQLLERTKLQYTDAMDRIVALDQEFAAIRARFKSVEPTEEIKIVSSRIGAVKTLLDEQQLKSARFQTEVAELRKSEENFAKLKRVEKSISLNPNIDTIKTEMRAMVGSLVAAGVEYQPEHPEFKQAQKKLESAKAALKKESLQRFGQESQREHPLLDATTQSIINMAVDNASRDIQVQFYKDLIEAYEKRQIDLATTSTLLQNLTIQRDALSATVQQVLKDRYKFEGILQKRVPVFRIVSAPQINPDNLGEYRYFPKRKKIVLFSALISVFVIFFFLVGRELKANLLYFGWQLDCGKKGIGCAEVPTIEPNTIPDGEREAFVCSRIQDLCASEKDAPLVRIVSEFAGEGKATVALALAWYFNQMNMRCVLVDGDLSGKSVSKTLGASDRPGWLDVLAGHIGLEQAVIRTESGIEVLPPGRNGLKRGAANGSSNLNELISRLAALYQRVIYIEPPFLRDYAVSADTIPAHDVIIVAESGAHSVLDIDEATSMYRFNNGGASLKWLVINKTPRVVDLFSPADIYRAIRDLLQQFRSKL